jgi:hypothetical protein
MKGICFQGKVSQYFIDDKNVSDTGDYAHIMPLAFLTFGNVYVEDTFSLAGHRALGPTHAPSVIRLIRLAVFFIYEFRAIFSAL